ncbi:iron ABC transporter permease [Clostridium gasigenes]|uniref:FecCD family ABC transporter permease n=1 Tax=Clostridium gasigenes TaxID=94869 RepID=UPI0016295DD1|nr:iron ABC transporter permease [Clostridium gasigenes]MBB6623787.1 iron ABC transporter permease [Clostridium gasigenes]MBU3088919.1 iron ABC transporter permease [Clostridium gasigenes]
MKKQRYTLGKGVFTLSILFILIVTVSIFSINFGKMNLSPEAVVNVLLGRGTEAQNLIVFQFRMPRIVLSILVGMGMGVSGCIMQSLLKNDMASPGTLGISSGSGLFMLIFVAVFSVKGYSSRFMLPIMSFLGGVSAALLIFILSYRKGKNISPTGLILTGVAMSSGYGALSLLLTLKLDRTQFEFVQRWQAGSLWGTDWKYIAILLPWILIIFLYVFYKSRMLNILNLGNETATGLGVMVKKEFLGLSLASVALSSGSVALGGDFFFVGMISPHLGRKLVGPDHRVLIPASALIGSLVVLAADTITRTVSLGADIPTGIIITVLSTPYFLYLLAKAN